MPDLGTTMLFTLKRAMTKSNFLPSRASHLDPCAGGERGVRER